jgi:type 1 glutamine amidotransferase
MYRLLLLLICCALSGTIIPQSRVLHFTRTSGFDHGTRTVSHAMFTSIGAELGVAVTDDATGARFDHPDTLALYQVIVFANTSGNAILSPAQQANFENWVAAGGRVMGIHAASDTYRHSTANGNNTGAWDYYAELIGASVQEAPNHVAGTPSYAMSHVGQHASTANLPNPWQKEEEYYYWQNGYFHPFNIPVLEVEETVGPNGMVNSYDVDRPMSWYRITENGRVFYTALGHATSNYTSDMLFRTHIKDALVWLLEDGVGIGRNTAQPLQIITEPGSSLIRITTPASPSGWMELLDLQGRVLWRTFASGTVQIDMTGRANGTYLIRSEVFGALRLVW